MAGHSEKPEQAAKTERSRAYSPIATPTCGEDEAGVVIIPKGMLAREKGESLGTSSQDFGAIASILVDTNWHSARGHICDIWALEASCL